MTDLTKIYEKYLVPNNLKIHMKRVAALAQIVTNKWTGKEIDKNVVIESCLLHDIAKPMTFDLENQAKYGMEQNEIDRLSKYQELLRSKYGKEEHDVAVKICKEIGVSKRVAEVVGQTEWILIPGLIQKEDTEALIVVYCDMRTGPKGTLSIDQRLKELKVRTGKGNFEPLGRQLDQYIRSNISMDLDSIDGKKVEELAQKFK